MSALDSIIQASSFVTSVAEYDVEVGEGTTVGEFCKLVSGTRIGKNCKVGSYVRTGRNCAVGDGCIIKCRTTLGPNTAIGNNVFIGPHTCILQADFGFGDSDARCVIGDNVRIGAGVIVARGVTIGDGAIIGAMSFVNKDCEPGKKYMGIPARECA